MFLRAFPLYLLGSWLASAYLLRAARRTDRISAGAVLALLFATLVAVGGAGRDFERPVFEAEPEGEWIAWMGIGLVVAIISVLVWLAGRVMTRPVRSSPGPLARRGWEIAGVLTACAGAALLVAGGVRARGAPSFEAYFAGLAVVRSSGEACPEELCVGHPVDGGQRRADAELPAPEAAFDQPPRCRSFAPDGATLERGESVHLIQRGPWCFPAVVYSDAAHGLVFVREYGECPQILGPFKLKPAIYAWRRTAAGYEPASKLTGAVAPFVAPRPGWLLSSAFGLGIASVGLAMTYAARRGRRAAPGTPASLYREAERRGEGDVEVAIAQRGYVGSMLAVLAVVSTSAPLVVYWVHAWG